MYLIKDLIEDIEKIITNVFDKKSLKLIIIGTFWNDNSNVCYFYDSSGKLIFKQNKFTPFNLKDKEERLVPKNNIINFLDIPNLGRIAILICKDICSDKIRLILKETVTNIVLCPAYSSSLNVERDSRTLAESHNIISIFANACAALNKKEYIGYCTVPQLKKYKSSCHFEKYGCNKCSVICTPKIIKISFREIINDTEVICCKISVN